MTTGIPSCAKNQYSDYERYQRDFDELKESVENDFQHYMLPTKINSLSSDIKNKKLRLPDCQTSNPDYDFSDLISRQDKLIEDFSQLEELYEGKVNFIEEFNTTIYSISRFLNEFSSSPYGNIDDEILNSFKKSDIDFIKNHPNDDTTFFNNSIKSLQEEITNISNKYNDDDFKENIYEKYDDFFADFDKESGLKKVNTLTQDMLEFQKRFADDNEGLQELISYGQKLTVKLDSASDSALDAIVVSDFHKDNINKIFFTSDIRLDPTKADASDFKTKFTVGENIKAITYLDKTISDLYYSGNTPRYILDSQSDQISIIAESVDDDERDNAYFAFYIITEAEYYINNHNQGCWTKNSMRFLSELPPRPKKVNISLDGIDQKIFGEFKFDCSDDVGLEKLKRETIKIQDAGLAKVTLPTAYMSNAEYENQLLELFNSLGWDEDFKQAIITSKEWKYKKSISGIIVARTLKVVMTSINNGKGQYQDFTVKQEKADQGYGSFDTHSVGSRVYIACDKIE